jgi:hypothetical protein
VGNNIIDWIVQRLPSISIVGNIMLMNTIVHAAQNSQGQNQGMLVWDNNVQ